jgi:N-hydroxyarylamine O-acetyltransferase
MSSDTATGPVLDWHTDEFDLDGYLARTGAEAGPPGTAALRALVRAHTLAVPFENVDVVLGRHPGLSPAAITGKLVHRRRGGYCYEHCLLFAAVAERLGYPVTRLSSRVRPHRAGARTHMTLLVTADGERQLVDVGFGAGMIGPMPLRDGVEVDQAGWPHRLTERDGVWTLSERTPDGWEPRHAFTTEPQRPVDYEVQHHYTSTHPHSPFVGRLVVMRLADGISRRLVGDRLTVRHADRRTATTVVPPERLGATLRDLDVELTGPELTDLLAAGWTGTAPAERTGQQPGSRVAR